MTVNFHHNGLVFNAKYTIEYRNNEEDCSKRPMVKCIFSSTNKAITINGNETFICPGKFYAKLHILGCVR